MIQSQSIEVQLAIGLVLSAAVTMTATPFLIWLARTFSFYDAPAVSDSMGTAVLSRGGSESNRKIHTGLIPRVGGIAIFLGFLASCLTTSASYEWRFVIFFSFAMFALGLWDDFCPVPAKYRLLAQLFITTLAVYFGGFALKSLYLSDFLTLPLHPLIGTALSVFTIIGAVNALNFIDGLDGLAGGISLIGIILLSLLFYMTHRDANVFLLLALPIMGSIIGFLRYNTHPATIFMGDGGSNWLGFMVGYFIILCADSSHLTTAYLSPRIPFSSLILCVAIPIFDTLSVIIARRRLGQSAFVADTRHIHHTLLRLGLSHAQTVTSIYAFALVLGLIGLAPALFPRVVGPWLPNLMVVILTLLAIFSSKIGLAQFIQKSIAGRSTTRSESLAHATVLTKLESFVRYCIYVILLGCPLLISRPSELTGNIAIATAAFILLTLVIPDKRRDHFFDSLVITAASLVILIANNQQPLRIMWDGAPIAVQNIYNGLFIVLGIATSILMLISIRREDIEVTPSDFLLIATPVFLLLTPLSLRQQFVFEPVALKALVVFLSVRVIGVRNPLSRSSLRIVTLVSLVAIYLIAAHGLHPVPFKK